MMTAVRRFFLVLSALGLAAPSIAAAAFSSVGECGAGDAMRTPHIADVHQHVGAHGHGATPPIERKNGPMRQAGAFPRDPGCPPTSDCMSGAACSAALGVTIAPSLFADGFEPDMVERAADGTPRSLRVAPESPPPRV